MRPADPGLQVPCPLTRSRCLAARRAVAFSSLISLLFLASAAARAEDSPSSALRASSVVGTFICAVAGTEDALERRSVITFRLEGSVAADFLGLGEGRGAWRRVGARAFRSREQLLIRGVDRVGRADAHYTLNADGTLSFRQTVRTPVPIPGVSEAGSPELHFDGSCERLSAEDVTPATTTTPLAAPPQEVAASVGSIVGSWECPIAVAVDVGGAPQRVALSFEVGRTLTSSSDTGVLQERFAGTWRRTGLATFASSEIGLRPTPFGVGTATRQSTYQLLADGRLRVDTAIGGMDVFGPGPAPGAPPPFPFFTGICERVKIEL